MFLHHFHNERYTHFSVWTSILIYIDELKSKNASITHIAQHANFLTSAILSKVEIFLRRSIQNFSSNWIDDDVEWLSTTFFIFEKTFHDRFNLFFSFRISARIEFFSAFFSFQEFVSFKAHVNRFKIKHFRSDKRIRVKIIFRFKNVRIIFDSNRNSENESTHIENQNSSISEKRKRRRKDINEIAKKKQKKADKKVLQAQWIKYDQLHFDIEYETYFLSFENANVVKLSLMNKYKIFVAMSFFEINESFCRLQRILTNLLQQIKIDKSFHFNFIFNITFFQIETTFQSLFNRNKVFELIMYETTSNFEIMNDQLISAINVLKLKLDSVFVVNFLTKYASLMRRFQLINFHHRWSILINLIDHEILLNRSNNENIEQNVKLSQKINCQSGSGIVLLGLGLPASRAQASRIKIRLMR